MTGLFILKHFPTLLLIRGVVFGLTVPKLRRIVAVPEYNDGGSPSSPRIFGPYELALRRQLAELFGF